MLLLSLPAFGNKPDDNLPQYYRNDVIEYGDAHKFTWSTLQRLLNQVSESARTPILSVLLEGQKYTGKTAIAAKLAHESNFPYIRMITPDQFIGMREDEKSNRIHTIFQDSYKSKLSVIIIDDIERIIGYSPQGPRFDSSVLQTLMIMIRKPPTIEGNRLLVIATTSIAHLLDDTGLTEAFSVTQHISQLQHPEEVKVVLEKSQASLHGELTNDEINDISQAISDPIGIKQLLETLEMAQSEALSDGLESISAALFLSCLHTRGF